MYGLLIVDDEPLITDSLAELFEEYREVELTVHTAYSAREALAALRDRDVDIVISDICMPGMSGLELHDVIKREFPETKVIFLSVHDEFEYAQAAVRNDGVDFVLKTEADEQLFRAVHKAVSSIEERKRQDRLVQDVKKQIRRALPFLWQDYLSRILEGMQTTSGERREIFRELEIPLHVDERCYLLLARSDGAKKEHTYARDVQLSFGIQRIVSRQLSGRFAILCISMGRSTMVWFLQPRSPDDNRAGEAKHLSDALEGIRRSVRAGYGISLTFGSTTSAVAWEDLSRAYDLLDVVLKQTGSTENVAVSVEMNRLKASDDRVRFEAERAVLSELKKMPLIQDYLESGQAAEFSQLFGELRDCVMRNGPLSPEVEEQVYYSLGLAFASCVNRARILGNLSLDLGFTMGRLDGSLKERDWTERFDYFRRLADLLFARRTLSSPDRGARCVRILNEYIDSHLGDDLSVVRLADVVNLNPSYLSRVYGQHTGSTLSDYITERKIERATELLAGSSLKMGDIAERLGFSSGSYFSRFFKKYARCTPEEYRMSCG